MVKINLLVFLLSFNVIMAQDQETIGLVYNDFNETKSEGYTLIKPTNDNRVFLINNCGEVVNQWDATGDGVSRSYFLENGDLLLSNGSDAEIRDWDNNIVWSISYSDLGFVTHHDIAPLSNGNFLVLVRDVYSKSEMVGHGLDVSFPDDDFQLERIIEIEPLGSNSANIVWEWKAFDHLIQDFDSSKDNYGVVANNPQLLDLNYGNQSNFMHVNAINYNEELDQIVFSARNLNEIYIIDHSTTTIEAGGHDGGIYGKGGDILWRWGNPEVYDKGVVADRKLNGQHDVKWITEGPNQGKISVFNNAGYGSDFAASSIHIIDQNHIEGVYTLNSGKYLPEDYFWSWDGVIMNTVMHEGKKCGVQIMSNGNALIIESGKGRITEVDNMGNVIWVYIIPAGNNSNYNQFSQPGVNEAFRATRYSENYIGFNGLTFNNTGIIEDVNSISANCVNMLSDDDSYFVNLNVYPNPTKTILNFTKQIDEIKVYDISGKVVLNKANSDFVNLESLRIGLYLIRLIEDEKSVIFKITKN
ncbi:aryl-sulfate sulfotransferase [Winogradskyella eckloniae]|uniref:aryl-sulfate sulfotransferase n=1 Tax=Winogradskyella eckloniae TaxID=1089306 RepID=UPI001563620B|nr:aryl-sulfate sulfotransferase [Winogradskyella eckloniae]NRD21136.1 aryl-sulfate sulfotransferase [Winogradskyella eckloniae]